jgi:NADH:ubiquinone oxidoreductase subunit F (NADH-binding)
VSAHRLLLGPDLRRGAERMWEHAARLGPLPPAGPGLIEAVESSGVQGRGGAWFPAAVKWRAVARRSAGSAVVVANGAEGEPLSWKDRTLMAVRPHLVWDGVFTAAGAVGADQVILYAGESHSAALGAMGAALAERTAGEQRLASIIPAPPRYVAGEETAAVHFINGRTALPTTVPPRPFERGVGGRATLVQNVETLAHAALAVRYGPDWYRSAGRFQGAAGTTVASLSGAVGRPGVIELELGSTVAEAITESGGAPWGIRAVLVGGYEGAWFAGGDAWGLPLDPGVIAGRGGSLGTSSLAVLAEGVCGVCETAAIMRYLAQESAAQCGPCFFGLRALADACTRIATGGRQQADLENLDRWAVQVRGRGACHHPDGAARLLLSALAVFSDEFAQHRPHAASARSLTLGRAA